MTKAQWKTLHRLRRIIRRESMKAYHDMMIFGTGVVHITPDTPDFIRHIPLMDAPP